MIGPLVAVAANVAFNLVGREQIDDRRRKPGVRRRQLKREASAPGVKRWLDAAVCVE
jgi:hypothetical protein